MSYSFVANAAVQGNGAIATSGINTAGADLLVIFVGAFDQSLLVITDTYLNTWTALTLNTGASATSGRIYYAKNASTGTSHIFTATGGSFTTLTVAAYSGSDLTAPFDVQSTGNSPGGGQVQPGSITPSNANSLVVSGCSPADGTSGAPTVSAGFTITDSLAYLGGNAEGGAQAYQIQTTATAANPTWAWASGGSTGAGCIAAFKPASGSGISGTAAWTEGNDIWAGSGGVLVSGTAAWTEGNDVWAGAGGVLVSGTAAWTEGNDTWSGSGTVASGTTGTAAWVEGNDTWAGSGGVLVSGTAAWVEGNDIWAGAGNATQPAATGTAAWIEANDNWAGIGSNGAVTVGGHFIPTRKELAALKKSALKEDKRRKREDEDRAKEQDTIAAEMRALLHPAPKQQIQTVEIPDDDEDENEALEMLLMYG